MYPHERSLVSQLAGMPFALVGVNSDGDVEALREIIKEKKLTWRSFQNEEGVDGKISDMWGIQGWPTVFIIDAEGVIRWKGHGGDMDSEIEKLLAELGHEVKITHDLDEDDDDEEVDDDDGDEDSDDDDDDGDSDDDKKDESDGK